MPSELVYQHQQQTPINGTISGMAPPGHETGIYYIPIANLPWHTSWQELKDYVRTVCSVEHVEINEDGTGGHVVLKGQANFDAAFRLLNGGIFHDRALIADGRNVDSWVMVKQHVNGATSSPRLPIASRNATTAQHTPSPITPISHGYSEWPVTSASSSYTMSPVVDSSAYFAMPEYTDSAAFYGMGGSVLEHPIPAISSAAPYPPGAGYLQPYTPSEYYGNSYVGFPEGNRQYVEAIPTKKRKIIIRQLQPWAKESQIRDLIRHKAGPSFEKLEKLDMPLADGHQGANRGYVIVTFESEEAAEKAVKKLNNYHFEGRALEVKHTKEGVSDHRPSHSSRSSHQRHSHHPRRERHDKDKKGKEKEKPRKTADSSEESELSSPKSDVIIANGSFLPYV
ncbi:hypothetical protein NUW58_g3411 [Xylaria curta]|uniref:Uncharacterized protein n=1 Tax=Xylaria curta TaxID=42375 RepID=A0ACC1PDG6_9PEZI|nr:hypothetical protein NUW58_g3411 [Xylaria curta]